MTEGPAAGLAALDALADEASLRAYHLLPSARAHLLEKLGRLAEARTEFERAASMTDNARQKNRLLERARALGGRIYPAPSPAQARSNRSRFMTLSHAATKSRTKACCESSQA